MAGPSVLVRFLADLTGLKQATGDVASAAKGAGSGLADAFKPGLNMLNQSGVLGPFQEALGGVGQSLDVVKQHAKDVPVAMAGIGIGIAGVGTALSGLGSKDQAAHQQLQASVEATGKAYDGFDNDVESAIKHQEHFGHTANETQDALRVLTQATNDPKKAMDMLGEASDLAASKHMSLEAASTALGKAYNGNTKIFKQFGIQVDSTKQATAELAKAQGDVQRTDDAAANAKKKLTDLQEQYAGKTKLTVAEQQHLRDAQALVVKTSADQENAHKNLTKAQQDMSDATNANGKALDQLADKLKGQAAAQADTFKGRLEGLKASVEDHIASLAKYGPQLQTVGVAMAGFGTAIKIGQTAMDGAKKAAQSLELAQKAGAAASKVAAAAEWILNAALDANPIVLVVIAIAAIIAGLILLATHVKAVGNFFSDLWGIVKDVWGHIWDTISTVFDWIKDHWPLLLGILMGPFGLVIALIYTFRDQIIGIIQAIPGAIAKIAADMWHWITDRFFDVIAGVQWVWSAIWDFLVGIPGAILGLAAGMWHFITDFFWREVTGIQVVWGAIWNFLTGLPGQIAGLAAGMWHAVSDQFGNLLGFLQGKWNEIWNWLSGLPGQISNWASGMWDGIKRAFQSVVDDVKGIWNAIAEHTAIHLHVSMPGPIPNIDVDTPQLIPSLQQGGLVTQTGLIYAHAGEAISPIPSAAMGPSVHIENVNLQDELDVEQFTRRLAWSISKERV